MSLPIVLSDDSQLNQMQTLWASQLNPVLRSAILAGNQQTIVLTMGTNVINHKLGRKLQGWFVTRMRGTAVQIYDTQDWSRTPELTLTLISSGVCTVDVYMY